MKKALLGLSGILVIAFVIIIVANAEGTKKDNPKAATATEKSMDCAKCPSASTCTKMTEAKATETKACNPATCKEATAGTAKCETATAACKASCPEAEAKKCEMAACPMAAKK